jgi:uncharacterized protein
VSATILADTGPLVALFNARDAWHEWAKQRFDEFTEPLVSCEAVLAEALFLLARVPGARQRLLSVWARGLIRCEFVAEQDRTPLIRLLNKYADLPMSFADACLVRLSEKVAECRIWTLDAHFRRYRRHGRQVIPLVAP